MLNLPCIAARKRFNFASYMLVSFWHTCFSQECAENEDFYILASPMSSSGGQLNSSLSKKPSSSHRNTSKLYVRSSLLLLCMLLVCSDTLWKVGGFWFFHTFCKVCACCTQALVTCSWAICVQSFISSVLGNAKPSTATLPLISDQLEECAYLKSIPNQIKLNVGIINPRVCTEQ